MKKIIGIIAVIAILLGGVAGVRTLPVRQASAGWMETNPLTAEDLSGDALNKNKWSIGDGISLSSGKIHFERNSEDDTKLLYRTKLYADVETSTYTVKATVQISSMTNGKKFGMEFGRSRINNLRNEETTNYFYVQKNGSSYVAGVCSYNADDEQTNYASSVAVSGTVLEMQLTALYPNQITAKIGSTTVFSGPVTKGALSGYFGFIERGETTSSQYAEEYVYNFTATNDFYDTPENVNIYDTFDDDSLDTSVWYLYNDAPYMKGIAETDGMLRFMDSNEGIVATRYPYSNFEMRLDVPYLKRSVDFNEDGSLAHPVSGWFGFMCGIESDDYGGFLNFSKIRNAFSGYTLRFATDMDGTTPLGETKVHFGYNDETIESNKIYKLPEQYDLWRLSNDGRTLNIVFTCIQGKYELNIKWEDETEYYKVFSEEFPLQRGYIILTAFGSGAINGAIKANMGYDNVQIINRDYKGKVLSDVEKASEDLFLYPEDYGYADSKSPAQLIENDTDFDGLKPVPVDDDDSGDGEKKDGCGSAIDLGTVATLALATLAAGVTVIVKKRRNER